MTSVIVRSMMSTMKCTGPPLEVNKKTCVIDTCTDRHISSTAHPLPGKQMVCMCGEPCSYCHSNLWCSCKYRKELIIGQGTSVAVVQLRKKKVVSYSLSISNPFQICLNRLSITTVSLNIQAGTLLTCKGLRKYPDDIFP